MDRVFQARSNSNNNKAQQLQNYQQRQFKENLMLRISLPMARKGGTQRFIIWNVCEDSLKHI